MTDRTDSKLLHYDLSYRVVGCIYDVSNIYGYGLKELIYQRALAERLEDKGIPFNREVSIRIRSADSGRVLGEYKLDFVVDEKIILELKSVKFVPRKIERQLFTYLRSSPYEVGYLVNFGSAKLFIKRFILTNDRKKIIR